MFGSRFISISVKLVVTIAVLLVGSNLATSALLVGQLTETVESTLYRTAELLSANVATMSANAVVGGDYNFLKTALRDTMEGTPDIVYGFLVDADNKVFAIVDKQKTDEELAAFEGKVLENPVAREAFENANDPDKPWLKRYFDESRGAEILAVARPIFVRDRRWAVMNLGFSFENVERNKSQAIRTSVITVVPFTLIGILLAFLVSRRITQPIRQLVQDAAAIAQGNLEKEVTVHTSDEVGILAHALERMRSSLRLQFKEIAKKAMGLEGELEVFALPDLLQLVCSSRRTGVLHLEKGDEKGDVYFDAGEMVHARLHGPGGSVESTNAVYRFFNWTAGSFKFDNMPVDDVPHTIDVGWQHLIMEGARKTDEMDRIKQVIPSADCIVSVEDNPPEGVDEIRLTMEELQISMLVQQPKTVGQIVAESDFEEFDTYQMLYRLVSAGLLKVEQR